MLDLSTDSRHGLRLVLCLSGFFLLAGCGGNQPVSSKTSKFEVADDSEGRESATQDASQETAEPESEAASERESATRSKSAATSSEMQSASGELGDSKRAATGMYKPPKGSPAVQMRFIKEILEAPIGGSSAQSQKLDYEDKRNAAIASCGLILADAKATNEEKQFAIMTKFRVLTEMSARLQDDAYSQQAMDFAAQLQTKDKGTIENELGVAIGVSLLPQQFSMVAKPSAEDIKKLVEGYLAYLNEGPLPPMYQPGLQIAKMVGQLGQNSKSIEVIEAMLAAFKNAEALTEKEQAVAELQRMLKLYQTDFPAKLKAAVAEESAFAALDASFEELLKGEEPSAEWLQFLYGVGATLEQQGKTESASKVYERTATLGDKVKDQKASEMVKKMLANAGARTKLLGTTLDFSAEGNEPADFKLSSLQGAPVVVLFWTALDGGASFNELENIQQVLLATRSAFEVVLVNVDDNPEIFKEFSEIQKLNWAAASVRCPDASKKGMESELEKQIGLDQLPFSVLVDAKGKVVATFAQGPRLESLMDSVLSSQEEKPEKEPAKGEEKSSSKDEELPQNPSE